MAVDELPKVASTVSFGWSGNETSISTAMEYVAGGDLASIALQGAIAGRDVKTFPKEELDKKGTSVTAISFISDLMRV